MHPKKRNSLKWLILFFISWNPLFLRHAMFEKHVPHQKATPNTIYQRYTHLSIEFKNWKMETVMLSYKYGMSIFQEQFNICNSLSSFLHELWIHFIIYLGYLSWYYRMYSRRKWHVMIQVNTTESTAKLDNSEVLLKQGAVQFGCKNNEPIGDTTHFNIGEICGVFFYFTKKFSFSQRLIFQRSRCVLHFHFWNNRG